METFIVRKLVSGGAGYQIPGELRERKWKGENALQRVPYDELERVAFDPSARTLFDRGYLYIEDRACRIKLGFESEDPNEVSSTNGKLIYDRKEIVTLLYVDDFKTFKEKVSKLADGSLELLIEVAVNTPKQLTLEKSDYIRNAFHVDVEQIQRQKRDDKTIVKEG